VRTELDKYVEEIERVHWHVFAFVQQSPPEMITILAEQGS
jgi:hypothetical protein